VWLRVCVALIAVPLVIAGGATSALSAKATGGRIVFSSDRDGHWDIYAVNPDGTGLTKLTKNGVGSEPVPSPDGKLIAFDAPEGAAVMNANGTGSRPLQCFHGTSWSPDSTRLVCRGSSGLVVVDATSGTGTPLTVTGVPSAADALWYPVWSPNGRSIAFVDSDEFRLWVVPAGGGAARRVGTRRVAYQPPSWSPDSQRLAYATSDDPQLLFAIGVDGSGERRLAKGEFFEDPPQWSPDGSQIAFDDDGSLYTVRPDGTGLRRVSVSAGGEASHDPAWSLDGKALAYERVRYAGAGERDLFVTSPSGGAGRAVTRPFPDGGSNERARWAPGARLTTTTAAPPRTIVLPRPQLLQFGSAVAGVVTDAGRAVAYAQGSCNVQIWDPPARRPAKIAGFCDPGDNAVSELTLAGPRLAWIRSYGSTAGNHLELLTLRIGAGRSTLVTTALDPQQPGWGAGATFERPVGGGSTIVFTFAPNEGTPSAWLLLGRHGQRCPGRDPENGGPSRALCRRLRGAQNAVSVDADRVLSLDPGGSMRLFATSGRLLRKWSVGGHADGAVLGGRTVAVQRGTGLVLFDAVTGAKIRLRALVSDEGPTKLVGVRDGLVAYATGGAIHLLRLSDGRDRALALPNAAPPLDAKLDPSGLFVSWNRLYDKRPGRVAFVPSPRIKQALARQ
jgi:Tol biopolymer transport system component